jgi:hypothetical protein
MASSTNGDSDQLDMAWLLHSLAIIIAAIVEHTVITNAMIPKTGNPIQNLVHHRFGSIHSLTSKFGLKGVVSK